MKFSIITALVATVSYSAPFWPNLCSILSFALLKWVTSVQSLSSLANSAPSTVLTSGATSSSTPSNQRVTKIPNALKPSMVSRPCTKKCNLRLPQMSTTWLASRARVRATAPLSANTSTRCSSTSMFTSTVLTFSTTATSTTTFVPLARGSLPPVVPTRWST